MTDLIPTKETARPGWRVRGKATIDDRPAVPCVLVLNADGTWAAELATFTFAGEVDLFLVADEGGHFCGPAFVARSRAESGSFAMGTELIGSGPLLVVDPSAQLAELPAADFLDAEVVEE